MGRLEKRWKAVRGRLEGGGMGKFYSGVVSSIWVNIRGFWQTPHQCRHRRARLREHVFSDMRRALRTVACVHGGNVQSHHTHITLNAQKKKKQMQMTCRAEIVQKSF